MGRGASENIMSDDLKAQAEYVVDLLTTELEDRKAYGSPPRAEIILEPTLAQFVYNLYNQTVHPHQLELKDGWLILT
jgi:hypothetical protein